VTAIDIDPDDGRHGSGMTLPTLRYFRSDS